MIASSKQKVEPKGKFLIDPEAWRENRCQRRSPSTDQPFPGAHLGELLQTLRWYSFCSLHGLLHNTSIIILAFIHQFQIACRLTLTFNFAKSYISFFKVYVPSSLIVCMSWVRDNCLLKIGWIFVKVQDGVISDPFALKSVEYPGGKRNIVVRNEGGDHRPVGDFLKIHLISRQSSLSLYFHISHVSNMFQTMGV